jgi:protein gp37
VRDSVASGAATSGYRGILNRSLKYVRNVRVLIGISNGKRTRRRTTINKTTIEWCLNPDGTPGFTSNCITGCLGPEGKGPCPYCYANTLAHGRLKPRYLANFHIAAVPHKIEHGDPFWPRWWPGALDKVAARKKPSGVFLCNMADILGTWVPLLWQKEIMDYINICKQHRFYILTKHPLNLLKFSPWPSNCYVGCSVDTPDRYKESLDGIAWIKAKVKFISFEPLLGRMPLDKAYKFDSKDVQWVIIGACTGSQGKLLELCQRWNIEGKLNVHELSLMKLHDSSKWTLQPRREWVEEIIIAAKEAGIKVFLKNNLEPLMGKKMMELKEVP